MNNPDFSDLSDDELKSELQKIHEKAEAYANQVRNKYLDDRKLTYDTRTSAGKNEITPSLKIETVSEKRLKEWDDSNADELKTIQETLSTIIAKSLGEITIVRAGQDLDKGTPLDLKKNPSATTLFRRTNEKSIPLKGGTRLGGFFRKKEVILSDSQAEVRSMELTKDQVRARKNQDYHSGKKPGNKETYQAETDEIVTKSQTDYTDLLALKRKLTTRQMELHKEREELAFSNVTPKILKIISQLS